MALELVNSVWVCPEGSFATDPSSNGSLYRWLNVWEKPVLKDIKAAADTNYQNDQNWPTLPIPTVDGWELTLKVPVIGLSAAATGAPVAVDPLDDLLQNVFGQHSDVSGLAVSAGSTTSNLVMPSSGENLQDLVPVYQSGLLAIDRTEWRIISDTASAPTYAIRPNWSTAPANTATAYGRRLFSFNDGFVGSLALIARTNGVDYMLLGGKAFSASLDVPANGGPAVWSIGLKGDTKTRLGSPKGSLPAVSAVTQPACLGLRSSLFFNGTAYQVSNVKLDLKLRAAFRLSQDGANGRAAARHIRAEPELSFDPLFNTGLEDLLRAYTTGEVIYQIGGGVLSGGVLNTCAISMAAAYSGGFEYQGRDGESAMRVTLKSATPTFWQGPPSLNTIAARVFQFARA